MKKIVFIIPYFGKLPDFFKTWLITANNNPTIDFFIFTDIDKKQFENKGENIKIYNISFEKLREKIQSLYPFKISLNQPYKLCDYKPAYGEIFSEYIRGYDFWGHCDLDMVFGDIRKFMNNDILEKYEKFQTLGFFALYKNIKKVNELYKFQGQYPEQNYQDVFQTDDACYFDEYRGMYSKTIRSDIKLYNEHIHRNPKQNEFLFYEWYVSPQTQFVLEYENGRLFSINVFNKKREEICFAHFFRRKFNVEIIGKENQIAIFPNDIIVGSKIKDIAYNIKDKKSYKIKYIINNLKKYRYSPLKYLQRRKLSKDSDKYNREITEEKNKVNRY